MGGFLQIRQQKGGPNRTGTEQNLGGEGDALESRVEVVAVAQLHVRERHLPLRRVCASMDVMCERNTIHGYFVRFDGRD